MRKNNDILELIENLEKKLVLIYPEIINSTFEFDLNSFVYGAYLLTLMIKIVIYPFNILSMGSDWKLDLNFLLESGLLEVITILFFAAVFGELAVEEEYFDANDVKEIKQYLKEVLDIKDYNIKSILLKNLRALKNILEQRDISEEERQMILEFLEEMNKLFSA